MRKKNGGTSATIWFTRNRYLVDALARNRIKST